MNSVLAETLEIIAATKRERARTEAMLAELAALPPLEDDIECVEETDYQHREEALAVFGIKIREVRRADWTAPDHYELGETLGFAIENEPRLFSCYEDAVDAAYDLLISEAR